MASSVIFDAPTHTYRDAATGIILPSVTTVLHAVGLASGERYTDDARDRGTLVHALVKQYLSRGDDSGSGVLAVAHERGVRGYLDAFRSIDQSLGLLPIAVETPMMDSIYGYAGTPDIIATDRSGRVVLVDVKTGAPQPWHRVQVEAYVRLAQSPTSYPTIPITARLLVYLTPTRGTIVRVAPTEWTENDRIWLAALRVYKTRERWRLQEPDWRRLYDDADPV